MGWLPVHDSFAAAHFSRQKVRVLENWANPTDETTRLLIIFKKVLHLLNYSCVPYIAFSVWVEGRCHISRFPHTLDHLRELVWT